MDDEYTLIDTGGNSVTVDRRRLTHAVEWDEPGQGRLLCIYWRPNQVAEVPSTDHLRSWLPCPIKTVARRPI